VSHEDDLNVILKIDPEWDFVLNSKANYVFPKKIHQRTIIIVLNNLKKMLLPFLKHYETCFVINSIEKF
jgi:hypothetical protein